MFARTYQQLASVPAGQENRPPGKGCRGISDGGRFIYATHGNNTLNFWRYDLVQDSWLELSHVPPNPSGYEVRGGTDLVFGVRNGSGCVYLLKGKRTDFYQYNTATDQWDLLQAAPTGVRAKYDEGSWLVYDGDRTIYCHKAKYHELWTYDIDADTWASTPRAGMPLTGVMGRSRKSKAGGCAAWYHGRILALKGGNTHEVWCYSTAAGTWRERETIPSVGSTGKKRRVKQGADIVCPGPSSFLALKGNKTLEAWLYLEPSVDSDDGEGPQPETRIPGIQAATQKTAVCRSAGVLGSPVVYDISGRIVRVGPDPRSLAAGVYLVRDAGAPNPALRRLVVIR